MAPSTSHDKDGKASFDDVYDAPDPRPYFRTLGRHDYDIGAPARSVFRRLLATRRRRQGLETPTMVDLCCSYGINAALVNHDVDIAELYDRYCDPALDDLTSEELTKADIGWYADRRRDDAAYMIGFDIAAHAIDYGIRVGLLDAGAAVDLDHQPVPAHVAGVENVNLVTVTGGLGYIGPESLERVLGAAGGSRPWFAGFALRWTDPSGYDSVLADHGLVLERHQGTTFAQRHFTDAAEREYCLDELAKLGLDASIEAETDSFQAELWVARPEVDRGDDLTDLLAGVV